MIVEVSNYKIRDIQSYWANLDMWHLWEALHLLAGNNPDECGADLVEDVHNYQKTQYWRDSFDSVLLGTATRSIDAGELKINPHPSLSGIDGYLWSSIKPKEFLRWAKSKGFSCKHLQQIKQSTPKKTRRPAEHMFWLKNKFVELNKPSNAEFWKYIEKHQDDIEEIDRVEENRIIWRSGRRTDKDSLKNILAKFRSKLEHG